MFRNSQRAALDQLSECCQELNRLAYSRYLKSLEVSQAPSIGGKSWITMAGTTLPYVINVLNTLYTDAKKPFADEIRIMLIQPLEILMTECGMRCIPTSCKTYQDLQTRLAPIITNFFKIDHHYRPPLT